MKFTQDSIDVRINMKQRWSLTRLFWSYIARIHPFIVFWSRRYISVEQTWPLSSLIFTWVWKSIQMISFIMVHKCYTRMQHYPSRTILINVPKTDNDFRLGTGFYSPTSTAFSRCVRALSTQNITLWMPWFVMKRWPFCNQPRINIMCNSPRSTSVCT